MYTDVESNVIKFPQRDPESQLLEFSVEHSYKTDVHQDDFDTCNALYNKYKTAIESGFIDLISDDIAERHIFRVTKYGHEILASMVSKRMLEQQESVENAWNKYLDILKWDAIEEDDTIEPHQKDIAFEMIQRCFHAAKHIFLD